MKHRLLLLLFLCVVGGTLSAQPLRYFEFDFHSNYPDNLNVFASTNDPTVLADVDAQLALPDSLRLKHLNGPITHGTGDNNALYSWHFVPSAWQLADFSIELCDGRPLEDVEADTVYWIGTVGQFCPWSSFVKREVFPLELPDRQPNRTGPLRLMTAGMDAMTAQNSSLRETIAVSDILDLQGRRLRLLNHSLEPGASLRIDLEGLPAGVYLLRSTTRSQGLQVQRFVVR
jgi:hypothetical protein